MLNVNHILNIMNFLSDFVIFSVNAVFDHANLFLTSLPEAIFRQEAGSGVVLAFALGAMSGGDFSEGVHASMRKWHGNIDEQFGNIDNVVSLVTAHQAQWTMPPDMFAELADRHSRLQALINKCRTNAASTSDRTFRSSLLKSTVKFCLLRVKIWAFGQFAAGIMTADDVHLLGFLLPGERGGHHARTEATDVIAEVKVKVINEDNIRVVIDQSAGENAAQIAHGWPAGVHNALIVITAADGKTEVYRQMTTRLHNDIRMPEGSHGKQFIIKASFLKHVDDEPRFGNEPTFSLPLTTADLAAELDRRQHEVIESQMREIERQRQIIERMQAELNEKK
jgi:hypothetical protein